MDWPQSLKTLLLRAILWFTEDASVFRSVALTCKAASLMARELAPMKKKDLSRTVCIRTHDCDQGTTMLVLPSGYVHGIVTHRFVTPNHELITVFRNGLLVTNIHYPQGSELWFGLDQLARVGDEVSCTQRLMLVRSPSHGAERLIIILLRDPHKAVECIQCKRCARFHAFYTPSTHGGGMHFLLSKPCNAKRLVVHEVTGRYGAYQILRRERILASFLHHLLGPPVVEDGAHPVEAVHL